MRFGKVFGTNRLSKGLYWLDILSTIREGGVRRSYSFAFICLEGAEA